MRPPRGRAAATRRRPGRPPGRRRLLGVEAAAARPAGRWCGPPAPARPASAPGVAASTTVARRRGELRHLLRRAAPVALDVRLVPDLERDVRRVVPLDDGLHVRRPGREVGHRRRARRRRRRPSSACSRGRPGSARARSAARRGARGPSSRSRPGASSRRLPGRGLDLVPGDARVPDPQRADRRLRPASAPTGSASCTPKNVRAEAAGHRRSRSATAWVGGAAVVARRSPSHPASSRRAAEDGEQEGGERPQRRRASPDTVTAGRVGVRRGRAVGATMSHVMASERVGTRRRRAGRRPPRLLRRRPRAHAARLQAGHRRRRRRPRVRRPADQGRPPGLRPRPAHRPHVQRPRHPLHPRARRADRAGLGVLAGHLGGLRGPRDAGPGPVADPHPAPAAGGRRRRRTGGSRSRSRPSTRPGTPAWSSAGWSPCSTSSAGPAPGRRCG